MSPLLLCHQSNCSPCDYLKICLPLKFFPNRCGRGGRGGYNFHKDNESILGFFSLRPSWNPSQYEYVNISTGLKLITFLIIIVVVFVVVAVVVVVVVVIVISKNIC